MVPQTKRPAAQSLNLKHGLPRCTSSKRICTIRTVCLQFSVRADSREQKPSSSAWSDGWDKKIPTVAPNYIIPPPSTGSQYDSNKFNDGFHGMGDGNGEKIQKDHMPIESIIFVRKCYYSAEGQYSEHQ
jgi:hypothetical protein